MEVHRVSSEQANLLSNTCETAAFHLFALVERPNWDFFLLTNPILRCLNHKNDSLFFEICIIYQFWARKRVQIHRHARRICFHLFYQISRSALPGVKDDNVCIWRCCCCCCWRTYIGVHEVDAVQALAPVDAALDAAERWFALNGAHRGGCSDRAGGRTGVYPGGGQR